MPQSGRENLLAAVYALTAATPKTCHEHTPTGSTIEANGLVQCQSCMRVHVPDPEWANRVFDVEKARMDRMLAKGDETPASANSWLAYTRKTLLPYGLEPDK